MCHDSIVIVRILESLAPKKSIWLRMVTHCEHVAMQGLSFSWKHHCAHYHKGTRSAFSQRAGKYACFTVDLKPFSDQQFFHFSSCFFHYAKLSVASSCTFRNQYNLLSSPSDDQGNQTALMSNVLVILSLDEIKVVGILSLRKTNYVGEKSGEREDTFWYQEGCYKRSNNIFFNEHDWKWNHIP